MKPVARFAALLIFVVAIVSLRAQFGVSQRLLGDAPTLQTLWRMLGYFTVLSNMLVAAAMCAVALRWQIGPRIATALVLWMALTGLIYHLFLSGLWTPQGMAWWADQGLHTAVPLLVLGWWLMFAPKAVSVRDIPFWLAWPAAYAIYALTRGAVSGFWAYPFLDAGIRGWGVVAINLCLMFTAFAGSGAALVSISRRLP